MKNKMNIDNLAEMFDLPAWDKIDDLNMDYYGEGLDWSDEGEAESAKIEDERRTEVYKAWHDSVEHAAESLLKEHGLKLEPVKFRRKVPEGTRPYEYRIVPDTSWADAATKIAETINGVGYFHFNGLKDFLRSGPYTARSATLGHLHWIKRYSDVYGGTSAKSLYERHFR